MNSLPPSPWDDIEVERDEWAAYLLLRDPNLLVGRETERVVNFYDPRTRTLAAADDPILDSKIEQARQRREKLIRAIVDFKERQPVWPDLEDEPFSDEYRYFDGEEEFELNLLLAQWRKAVMELRQVQTDGIEEVINEDGDTRWRKADDQDISHYETEVLACGHFTEEALTKWRTKLRLYIDRIRLASLLIARRQEFQLSQNQFATYAQVSPSTIKNFENVDEPDRWFSPKTIQSLERALGWQEGSITSVLRGAEPSPIPGWRPPVGIESETAASGHVSGTSLTSGAVEGRMSVRLDDEVKDLVWKLAVAEDRPANAVIADAVRFYAKYHVDEESS
jgi:hypothetical protein